MTEDEEVTEIDGEVNVKIDGEYIPISEIDTSHEVEWDEDPPTAMKSWGTTDDPRTTEYSGSFEFDVSDPDEVETLIDSTSLSHEAMRESLGDDSPTARQLRRLINTDTPGGSGTKRMEYMPPQNDTDIFADEPDVDAETFSTRTIEVNLAMSEELMETIADRIEEREREGYKVEQLVVGVKQYKSLLAWSEEHYATLPEDALPVEDLIVVQPPMIHPVIPPKAEMMRSDEG